MTTLRQLEYLSRQAESFRQAAAAEQAAADRLKAEGKDASAWSAASCAMEFRRNAYEIEKQIEDEQAQLEERLDLLAGQAAEALAAMALASECSIEDAIEAVRSTAEARLDTDRTTQANRLQADLARMHQ